MLNLLKFRDVADYSQHGNLAPESPITGEQAYLRYMQHTMPFLLASGGELLFYGDSKKLLVGPAEEHWDAVMLVRQSSVQSFWPLQAIRSISRESGIELRRCRTLVSCR